MCYAGYVSVNYKFMFWLWSREIRLGINQLFSSSFKEVFIRLGGGGGGGLGVAEAGISRGIQGIGGD